MRHKNSAFIMQTAFFILPLVVDYGMKFRMWTKHRIYLAFHFAGASLVQKQQAHLSACVSNIFPPRYLHT
jgi:hypothetical protein